MTAVSTAVVATPNQLLHMDTFMGMKAAVYDVTLSGVYTDNGDVLTAAALGWSAVYGAIKLSEFATSTGENQTPSNVRVSSDGSAIYFRAYISDDADAGGDDEHADSADLDAFTGRFIILGA